MREIHSKVDKPALAAWQIRAARAAVGLSASELATLAKVSVATVFRAENGTGEIRRDNLEAVREALEKRGVAFTDATLTLFPSRGT